MGEVRFFSTAALKAILAPLGIPTILLLAPSLLIRGQQRPSVDELLPQFERSTVFWQQFEV